jgi:hypothetical protein
MLEPTTLAPTGAVNESRSPARTSRSSARKRRRSGIVLPAFFLAVLLVAVVAVAAKVMSPMGSGANSLDQAIESLPRSGSVAALVQERNYLINMEAAVKTLTIASKPAMVKNPAQLIASQGTSSSSVPAPPDPVAAQRIGYSLLPTFGFSQQTQWTCLLDLWNRESGWIYDAENPTSDAYGIPQALPGDKMATAGADWLTDPRTQIIWGLGYIKTEYGTPCNAWNFDLDNGGY